MFRHTCARNTMYTCILKLTSQIYLIFDSLISLNFSSKFKFFRFAYKDRLDVHAMTSISKLIGIWPFH